MQWGWRLPIDCRRYCLRQRDLRDADLWDRERQPRFGVAGTSPGADVRRQWKLPNGWPSLVRRLPMQRQQRTVQEHVLQHHLGLQRPCAVVCEQLGREQLHRNHVPETAERRGLQRGLFLREWTLCRRGLLWNRQLWRLHGLQPCEQLGQDRRYLSHSGRRCGRAARPVLRNGEQLVWDGWEMQRIRRVRNVDWQHVHAKPGHLCRRHPPAGRHRNLQR